MTVREAANALGISTQRIRQLIASGRLVAVRKGLRAWEISTVEMAVERKNGRPRKKAEKLLRYVTQ